MPQQSGTRHEDVVNVRLHIQLWQGKDRNLLPEQPDNIENTGERANKVGREELIVVRVIQPLQEFRHSQPCGKKKQQVRSRPGPGT